MTCDLGMLAAIFFFFFNLQRAISFFFFNIYLFSCARSFSQRTRSLVATCKLLVEAYSGI